VLYEMVATSKIPLAVAVALPISRLL